LAEIEGFVSLLLAPGIESFTIGDGHVIGVVIMSSWVGSHVVLVLLGVEKMMEISLDVAEILPKRRKTLINQSLLQF
jgi:hypothetical protein